MKPLILLLVCFLLAGAGIRVYEGTWDMPLAGKVAMAIMLLFTGAAHFKFMEGMTAMLPAFIPFRKAIVYATGIFEIVAAAGLLCSNISIPAAWSLIVFFVLVLPANIYAALRKINYENPGEKGPSTRYLWFRVPLQLFFIAWVYFFAVINH
ncbi:hypothetical protein KRR40_36200 [Niabella defluvii]|jgi:uncharacterized membrane protein|nr:hypothetical protein KRR40_36200 [Niabella sp. I65]